MAKHKKRSKSSREAGPEHELPGGFWRQVVAVLMIVLSIVMVMTWFGSGGSLLNNFHRASLFCIGYASYAVPVILVYLAVKIFRAVANRLPVAIWIASVVMILWLAGLFGLPTLNQPNPTGGLIGAGLNALAIQILTPSVAAFIYAVLIFITGIFILQVSPVAVFKSIANALKTSKKEDAKNAKIARAAEKSETTDNSSVSVNINSGVAVAKHSTKEPVTPKPAPTPEKALMAVSDPDWKMPSFDLLTEKQIPADSGDIQKNANIIRSALAEFGIEVEMGDANIGPRVTQYTMRPPSGVNLSKILARDKELALNLAIDKIRIEAPIPGTRLVGVEIPNVRPASVNLRSILESPEWEKNLDSLSFAVGKDISGQSVIANLAKMPHLLIAGTTGSGKSVMTNTLLCSLLYHNSPSDMKLIIVDPKQVEMVQYNDIPHLLTPVINSTDKALSALKWAVNEMERRYSCIAEARVKKIEDYNAKMAKKSATIKDQDGNEQSHDGGKMPYIIILIDEMADLMMMAGKDLEALIVRIAQKGRAAGIHLVLATQRPEVKVITGLIKANVPARISFAVDSQVDSRIVLNSVGAEKLLGKGDMLMRTTEMMGKPRRIQGAFTPDIDIDRLTNFLREQRPPEYNDDVVSQPVQIKGLSSITGGSDDLGRKYDPDDPLVRKAIEITLKNGKFSTASLQTWLGKGHGYVAGLAIWLEQIGAIGPQNGNKPREILINSMEDFEQLVSTGPVD